jgi:predicted transcriptional regulator of viral defense system
MTTNLTRSQLNILKALDAAQAKTLSFRDTSEASGLTFRGLRIVLHRLEDQNMLARCDQHGLDFTLTFGGMRALKAELVAA